VSAWFQIVLSDNSAVWFSSSRSFWNGQNHRASIRSVFFRSKWMELIELSAWRPLEKFEIFNVDVASVPWQGRRSPVCRNCRSSGLLFFCAAVHEWSSICPNSCSHFQGSTSYWTLLPSSFHGLCVISCATSFAVFLRLSFISFACVFLHLIFHHEFTTMQRYSSFYSMKWCI
jgi:hypothetical protein